MEIVYHCIYFHLHYLNVFSFKAYCFYYYAVFMDTTSLHLFTALGIAMDSRPRRCHGSGIKSVESGNGKW